MMASTTAGDTASLAMPLRAPCVSCGIDVRLHIVDAF
jgi:hypothetical protein